MSAFTDLERFALCQAMPRANLPALPLDSTDRELLIRRAELCIDRAYAAYGCGENGLVAMLMSATRDGELIEDNLYDEGEEQHA